MTALPKAPRAGSESRAGTETAVGDDHHLLLERMCVFVDGCSIDACRAVAGGAPLEGRVAELVAELVDHDLVDVSGGRGAAARIRLHDPVRDAAVARLATSGERAGLIEAHRRYYEELIRARSNPNGFMTPTEVNRLAADHENCVGAVQRALDDGDLTGAGWMTAGLMELWIIRGWLRRGISILDTVLDVVDEPQIRVRLLEAAAMYRELIGDGREATRRAEELGRLGAELGDKRASGLAVAVLADVGIPGGKVVEARRRYRELQERFDRRREPDASAFWYAEAGALAVTAGDDSEAEVLLAEATRLFRRIAPVWFLGRVLTYRSVVARRSGDLDRATRLLGEALDWIAGYGAAVEAVACTEEAALVARMRGHVVRAVALHGAAARLRSSTGVGVRHAGSDDPVGEVEHLRATCPDEMFANAWTAGYEARIGDLPALFRSGHGTEIAAGAGAPTRVDDALSPREHEVAALVARGFTNREVATALNISPGTARAHVERILGKLGITSRVQIATWAVLREPGVSDSSAGY